ncbi:MAG: NAD(P) transhydrogenase subunit alpha [Deltaproteobacteria bacterium]|nr:NAD(P) transhydrogenase subunit alpha [Deltaproteobacteria bacterium]MBW2413513.1 NAD(P) transhydrogenase subunit alpha [Deltaproteobacteria bacterium]
MIVGVLRETVAGETRVALTARAARGLVEAGVEIRVQAGAGEASGIADADYEEAGAAIAADASTLLEAAELLVKVQPPTPEEIAAIPEGRALVCTLAPLSDPERIRALAERNVTAFALELMPRITVAQSMDVLSAMSTVTGYQAVLVAATALPKFFPLLMTAAGTIKPARVLVLGAGVAGLQAIATARRLGAVVEAFDVRAAVKEQVESLGARFVEQPDAEDAEDAGGYAKEQTADQLEAQRRLLGERIAEADVVICTALVPGRRAPVLMTEDQVKAMKPGSVVVDLAAGQGGNCEVTRAGEIVDAHGVQVHGPVNLAAAKPVDASNMFATNVANYLSHLIADGQLVLDLENELTSGPLVAHQGNVVNEAVKAALEA